MKLKIKRLNSSAIIPEQQSEGAAGIDLAMPIDLAVGRPNSVHYIKMGFAIEVPKNHMALIAPRSSLHKLKASLANTLGIIDSDYRGEIIVPLLFHGDGILLLERGQRIAQLIVTPTPKYDIIEVQRLTKTGRGDGGFGSTGTK